MKKTGLLLDILFALLLVGCRSQRVQIDLRTFDEMEGKMAYLTTTYDEQLEFLDSCRVEKGRIRLVGTLPHEEDLAEIMIPHEKIYLLLIARGERIRLNDVNNTLNSYFPPCEGSFATNKIAEVFKRYREIEFGHVDTLRRQLELVPEGDPARTALERQVAAAEQELTDLVREALNNDRSALLAIVTKMGFVHRSPEVTMDSLNRITEQICARFPNSAYLTLIDPARTIDPPTPASIRAHNRKARLQGRPLPYPTGKSEQKRSEPVDYDAYTPYREGDTVEDLALPGPDGSIRALSQLDKDYILIDFWASWCGPCCREIPRMRAIEERFRDVLAIYAASLDSDAALWKEAIKKHEMGPFANVLPKGDDPANEPIMGRFNIRAIPYNFLIDKNRRIVAIDLRGEALERKLEELTGK